MNGLLSAFAVLCLGVIIGKNLDFEGVLAIGAAISVTDILSFTKYGKHTMNARAMSNVHFMSKLIVYGEEKKMSLCQPVVLEITFIILYGYLEFIRFQIPFMLIF